MKKLCTYLTLFVLGLLALAQPAAAANFVAGTTYYIDASAYTGTFEKIVVYDGKQDHNPVTTVSAADKIYSWVQSRESGTVYIKRNGYQGADQLTISDLDQNNNCIKINSAWNGYSWTTYTPGGSGDSTDYTFYVDASSTGWKNVYLRLWNGNSTWNASGTRYLEPTETLSNGVKKFVVKGVTQVGQMMFRSVNSDGNWDAGNESKDISTPVNGTLYTLTTKDTNYRNKWNFTTKADYEEPAVKPVVSANPASCTFYGSQEVTLSADKEGAKIYYTTDGTTEPSESNGTEYSAPLSFTETTTLKAVAILDGVSSDVITYTYTKKEEGVYTGNLWVKGPAYTGTDWKDYAYYEVTNTDGKGLFWFESKKADDFCISSSNDTSDKDIYYHETANDSFTILAGKGNAVKLANRHIPEKNFKTPGAGGRVYVDMTELKIWYEPKSFSDTKLYILGSSDAIEGDWKNAAPIAMNYDATKDVFFYMVQGSNASPAHPIEFLISRGASNVDFFKAENAFMPVRDGYIHMAEPSYMKGKPGYDGETFFKLLSRGRVMAKYIKDKDGIPTGLKIWYEPVIWPDLYALGSIIAKPGDKKSELGDKTSQWHTFVKLEKDEKQAGLYYYDLGCGDKETKDLFNKEDYEASGVFGTINELGHFNFSFLSGTDTGVFWKDAFVPAVGQGMGTLNRDGVPVPFQYRDSDPGRYDRDGGWTSTNFVFGERCRIWVDVVRQIVWVQPLVELSDNQVVFDFWDKGGKKYPDGNKYKWWSTTDKATRFAQVYIKDATLPEGTTLPAAYRITAEDLSWMSEELENGVAAGARYHFVASLPTDFFEADGKTVIGGGHLWVRIKNGDNGSHEMLRPYAYQATYTQGPESDPDFNKYGNILAKGDPIVTIEPSVHMIYADVKAPEHLGNFRESHIMHYPYVNQYSTAVTVNDGNVYPFWVEGLTEPAKNVSDETIADQYVPVEGAPVVFEKSNQVTVSYGSIRETKYGTTGKAVIKGIDHANAKETDKMEVKVTYTSPGLIFARTKTEPLKIDANELPTMQNSKDTPLDVAAFYSGTACSEGLTVDLILHQEFAFSDIMTQGRAAYIGYEVNIYNPNALSHVAEGHVHMAKNGVPLMWDFTDDHKRNITGFTDLDKWHYEAFTGKSMAIQLHHVLCGKTKAELANKSVTGTVTFHLYVPVATDFAFETGTTSLVRGMHKAGEEANPAILGDPKHPYTGSVSAKSYDQFTHEFTFNTNGNITTGVEGVGVEDAPVEYYNLQGVRMTSDALAPGIYIRRQGNETSKVYIR